MYIMISSKKKARNSDVNSEEKKSRTFPTLKLNFAGSMRQQFAMEALLLNETQNVCSPVSAMMPLGKLALGVKGRAESEILELLGINLQTEVLGKFQQLVFYLEHLPGVKLRMTSRLYVPSPDKSKITVKFKNEALYAFKTDIDELDFDDSEQAAQDINDYVRIKTQHAIDEIITPKQIPSKESILVVNAISFEPNWRLTFDGTKDLPFYSTRLRHNVIVPMMTRKAKYFFTKSDALNARLVEIQFEQNHASMVVLLPHSEIGLGYLIRTLKDKPDLFNEALRNMTMEEVSIAIPKFNIVQSTFDLKQLYETIGLFHIFRKKSGLTGIIQNKELKVARAIQKCSFEIQTDYVIADGSSISDKVLTSGFNDDLEFTVNKPFLYYVIMKTLNEQLFVGIYNEFEKDD